MSIFNILTNLEKNIKFVPFQERHSYSIQLSLNNGTFAVCDELTYVETVNQISSLCNKILTKRFHPNTIDKFISDKLQKIIIENNITEQSCGSFFQALEAYTPRDITTYIPISGCIIDGGEKSIEFGPFTVSNKMPNYYGDDQGYTNCFSLKIDWHDVYDLTLIEEKTEVAALDFCKLIFFMAGLNSKDFILKIGYPTLNKNTNDPTIIVPPSGIVYFENKEMLPKQRFLNDFSAIKLNEELYYKNPKLNKVWELYKMYLNEEELNELQKRLLHVALSVGESFMSTDIKTGTLYSCIALESLLNINEAGIFNRSIGIKLAEGLAFLLGENEEERKKIYKFTQDMYSVRSAISHGGVKTKLDMKYRQLNLYIRNAVVLFLNHDIFSSFKSLKEVNEYMHNKKFTINYR